MTRTGLWLAVIMAAMCLPACEQSPAPGGGGNATTQPAGQTPDEPGVSLDDVKRTAKEAVGTAMEYARQKKEEYQKRVEPELAKLNKRIDDLKQKVSEAAEEARPELEKRFNELAEKAKAAREKFDRVKDASGEAWEDARKGLDEALEELQQAMDEAAPATPPATQPGQPETP